MVRDLRITVQAARDDPAVSVHRIVIVRVDQGLYHV